MGYINNSAHDGQLGPKVTDHVFWGKAAYFSFHLNLNFAHSFFQMNWFLSSSVLQQWLTSFSVEVKFGSPHQLPYD